MFDNYIIEVRPPTAGVTLQAGIVVRDGRNFRFFAASDIFHPLEGQRFDSPKTAERAALRCLTNLASRRPATADATTGPGKIS
jgi:hypothetical protein